MSPDTTFDMLTRLRDRLLPRWWQAWWSSPRGLLTVFVGVHLVFLAFALGLSLSGAAFSDTYIYREWARAGFDERNLGPEPSPWVYPVLALVPIALAGAAGPGPFFFLWVLLITVLNGWAVGKLTNWGRDRHAFPAAWWWLGFVFLMGWLGFARVDGLTAPLVLVALVHGVAHPVVASVLLSIATWMKVWPAAVVLTLVAVTRRRVAVVVAGLLVSAAAAGVAAAMGALPRLFDFLTQQGDRGMQLEATFTTPWLWLSVLGVGDSRMYMNTEINSMQVDGPGTGTMAVLMQPLLLLAASVVTVLIVRGLRNGERSGGADRTELLLAGSLTMVTAFIVFNKVGSPQFMVWLAPAVAVGLTHHWKAWRVPAAMLIAIAVATFLVYPLFYYELSHNHAGMALVLTLRNALLVVLLWWSARRLYGLGTMRPATVLAAKES
ncbi:glycosyltransferase 87 family protein [Kocuria rhizosphaericola]|uniref:glycosyltransferase 87 family protein n=1 Tax=Kocuria rhizosphaericola TaxID=3376284 RepID=UPI0037A742DF